jgi:hypothetical protein
MYAFRTEIEIPEQGININHQHKCMFVGSCFAESIGKRMADVKIPVDINPMGIQYNPVSVQNTLEFLMNGTRFSAIDLNHNDELWYSLYHHSQFSHFDQKTCLRKINERLETSSEFLKEADFLFITFGTAWVFEDKKTGIIVSNCHKQPANKFDRFMLMTNEIISDYQDLIEKLQLFNPKLQIVFTVSPIRHFKDGFVANQLSKSSLIVSVHQLANVFKSVSYFPSFEIMMDDLRDYRFYEEDMIHPNHIAINYIWNKFADCYFGEETRMLNSKIEKIIKAKQHKPFNPDGESYKTFKTSNLEKIDLLLKRHSYLDLKAEIDYFSK